ncbi:HesA/MoeB/ThiF family protein [Salinimonas sediminis]|uniref:HesA/MoeB/ThiF family protein n=1 Tax=Salinimonas sediminis TaxID=2303538 RepID=A0A346NRP6_9ALTE|nr:HesA/MoeB/ThiF family protein [Salinimonas sediminis]AXR08203.1 HesA/MoeB/ThiF family protein [Salinimonas sediminis]
MSNVPDAPQQWYSRYSRHFLLENFDETHQQRLQQSHLTVIGMGGLGTTAAQHLAASGAGTLSLVDADTVCISNLPRQLLYSEADIGRPKVFAAREHLQANNPGCIIETHVGQASSCELPGLCGQTDAILDCTDNIQTRLALSRYARSAGLPLFSAAAAGYSAQVIAFNPAPGHCCYGCLYGLNAIAPQHCLSHGVLGPVVASAALFQALQVLYFVTRLAPVSWGSLYRFDARTLQWLNHQLPVNLHCEVCQS